MFEHPVRSRGHSRLPDFDEVSANLDSQYRTSQAPGGPWLDASSVHHDRMSLNGMEALRGQVQAVAVPARPVAQPRFAALGARSLTAFWSTRH